MIDTVLSTLRDAFADPTDGIAAKVTAIADARGYAPGYLSTDYEWERWSLSDVLHPATSVRGAFAPISSTAEWRPLLTGPRDALHRIRLTLERVAPDMAVLEDGVTADALAAMQVLDTIHVYSRAHGGDIALVDGPIAVQFGSFGGPATARGSTIDFTVLERSQE